MRGLSLIKKYSFISGIFVLLFLASLGEVMKIF